MNNSLSIHEVSKVTVNKSYCLATKTWVRTIRIFQHSREGQERQTQDVVMFSRNRESLNIKRKEL